MRPTLRHLREVEGYRFGYVLIDLEGYTCGVFHGGDTHVRVLLLEDICNRSPGFCAFVPREETPSPLPVGCLTDGLAELPREHCLVKNPRHGVVLLLAAEGSPDLSGSPFEEYEDKPETVPLDFTEDDVTWVASKLSGATDALGAEAIELHNWLLRFRCTSEELRVVVASLADWMENSSPPLGCLPHTDGLPPSCTG